MDELIKWQQNPNKKPLILQGVRQCGKTYLLNEFGSNNYDDVFYCNFDDDKTLANYFEANLNPHRIIKDLSVLRNKDIKPHTTLIIFDEVQTCGNAISSLKYFCEKAPEYHIIAAGSLLGVAIPKGTSFPVGKVEFLTLFPMNFYEFLLAQNAKLAEHLKESGFNDDVYVKFKTQLEELYHDFLIVGGMPEVVQSWIDNKSIESVEKIQSIIIKGYENDFAKHATTAQFPKLSAIWDAIPSQLAKENRKFIFSQIKKSWRAKDLEDALEWLIKAGLVYKIEKSYSKDDIKDAFRMIESLIPKYKEYLVQAIEEVPVVEEVAVIETQPEPVAEEVAVIETQPEPVTEEVAVIEAQPEPVAEEVAVIETQPEPVTEEVAVIEAQPEPVAEEVVVIETQPEPAVEEQPTIMVDEIMEAIEIQPEPVVAEEPMFIEPMMEEAEVVAEQKDTANHKEIIYNVSSTNEEDSFHFEIATQETMRLLEQLKEGKDTSEFANVSPVGNDLELITGDTEYLLFKKMPNNHNFVLLNGRIAEIDKFFYQTGNGRSSSRNKSFFYTGCL